MSEWLTSKIQLNFNKSIKSNIKKRKLNVYCGAVCRIVNIRHAVVYTRPILNLLVSFNLSEEIKLRKN